MRDVGRVSVEERMGMDREVQALEARLGEVEGWERRVKEVRGLLSVGEGGYGD